MKEIEHLNKPGELVQVFVDGGEVLQGERGLSAEAFLQQTWQNSDHDMIVGAVINGHLKELMVPINLEVNIKPVKMSDADGALIYRRSLTFLLGAVFEELYPDQNLVIDHSVSSGGYYCQLQNEEQVSEEMIQALESKMREYVEADLPFRKEQVALEDAKAMFFQRGQMEKVKLLEFRKKSHLILYSMGDHKDYHHGYMVPSTGYLKYFALEKARNGFIMRFPRRRSPDRLENNSPSLKLLDTFSQYRNWLNRLQVDSIGGLNQAIQGKRIHEIVLVAEALHEQKIASIAQQIMLNKDDIHLILIAGPSSSGKTTSSKRLTVQLIAQGITPYTLELDNYFVSRERTPRDENGQYDFESLRALDIDRLNSDLKKMVSGEKVRLPKFNFISGQVEEGDVVQIKPGQKIIMEGIHGLNPDLLPGFGTENTYRIYASCLTQLNLDRYNRISTTDTRLIRRIVRDARDRGYTARDTIARWDSVRRGEKSHIFPFQDFADEMLNTALVYELAVLKNYAEPLLRQVSHKDPEYIEANRLLSMLEWFLPLDSEVVPDNSIIREFVGGSILKNFDPRGL
jgi:uridine kinase